MTQVQNQISAREVIESTRTIKDAYGRIIPEKQDQSVKSKIFLKYLGEDNQVETTMPDGTTQISNVIKHGEVREFNPTDARDALMIRVGGKEVWEYEEGSQVVWGQAAAKPIGVGDMTAMDFDMASFIKEAAEYGIVDKISGSETPEELVAMLNKAKAEPAHQPHQFPQDPNKDSEG